MDGTRDVLGAVDALAARLPEPIRPLARIAYDYSWSWMPGGSDLFARIAPHRWWLSGEDPIRFLTEVSPSALERAAVDDILTGDIAAVAALLGDPAPVQSHGLVAFFCTEFAIHPSLPLYSGGLGVLAGDILKEASDRGRATVGVGLLYRQGYFRQRIDQSGWQHEFWGELDPDRAPMALVSDAEGAPLTISVSIRDREIVAQVWRLDVGRVPLYLLDAQRPENDQISRWITQRLYTGDRRIRLEQYALLGLGGMRALHAMGIEPDTIHLNEGHAALAPLELVRHGVAAGAPHREALEAARSRVVFTTHTPISAGNEAYTGPEVLDVLGDLPRELDADAKDVLALGRIHPVDEAEPFGLTPLGLRVSRAANGVSKVHGRVAREMWKELYPDRGPEDVPITHVTNGVHLPTWMAPPFRALLTRHLGDGWEHRAAEPQTWEGIEAIPDEELWQVRNELRAELVAYARERAIADRLGRGEPIEYVEAATRAFDPGTLTIGFARRATAYKRLYLLTHDPGRALALLADPSPAQILLAGKPHPQDEEAKRILQKLFELKWAPPVSERAAFIEDYDMRVARHLVAGCDVWLNLPRAPLEACGTSGMKAALNGGLNLSVLDGWWAEAFDGTNGWAIESHPSADPEAQDAQDAAVLYDVLEREVVPLFYERDDRGIPYGWVRRIKDSLRSIGPRFNATRMLNDYRDWMYAAR